MNVSFVSQCSGRALNESRRILDQFAERRGERSWQTPITWEGLKTAHKLLRRTARKNTSVACFWIHRNRNELLWIVGDARRFNTQGATPTNSTARDQLRTRDENDWHHGEIIRLLSAMAALFHDFGKASAAFQAKLRQNRFDRDAFRHEWVSLRLFAAFVGEAENDRIWLRKLDSEQSDLSEWRDYLVRDGVDQRLSAPLKGLPPLARAVGWLIVSHHRLPVNPECDRTSPGGCQVPRTSTLNVIERAIKSNWGSADPTPSENAVANTWRFEHHLPFSSRHWRQRAERVAKRLLTMNQLIDTDWLAAPQAIHLARLGLILADHYYSSGPSQTRYGDSDFRLYANTGSDRQLKQRLDEHLIGVEVSASRIVRTLPRLVQELPRIAHHRGFRQRTLLPAFHWQNRAFDKALGLRNKAERHGFFGINMASTGTGKTLANGRILYALAHPELGARFTLALGLRTLTLQTGDAYRERMHLGSEDLAVLVGGGAIRELREHNQSRVHGSESADELLPEQTHVHFEGSLEDGPLNHWLQHQPRALLQAPVVACTIDHLMPATEGTRGGRQILPMLRLLTSDLVLDEVDDFDPADLHAVTRLVHWAGMLGSRILLSSATIPPALAQGLFQAYCAGRRAYQDSRGEPGLPLQVCCGWFDEFDTASADCAQGESFHEAHRKFVTRRVKKLRQQPLRRHVRIISLQHSGEKKREAICETLVETVYPAIHEMHRDNALTDPVSGKTLSIGVIRMANIDPLVQTARYLIAGSPETDHRLHLCVYHSQFPLLLRHVIEKRLDRLLRRDHDDPHKLFEDPEIRALLDTHPESHHMLVVLASPVAEVGRDHDYDWAIVEPSSLRAIIQLAGRVRRHRREPWEKPNLGLLSTNIKALTGTTLAFRHPGFETKAFSLATHNLTELLRSEERERVDATWRILEPVPLDPKNHLADLEHAVLRDLMLGNLSQQHQTPVTHWWRTRIHLTGVLQAKYPFRAGTPTQAYWLLPNEEGNLQLYRREMDGARTLVNHLIHRPEIKPSCCCSWWGTLDDNSLLEEFIEENELEPDRAAVRFMTLELPTYGEDSGGWLYHPALGFSRRH